LQLGSGVRELHASAALPSAPRQFGFDGRRIDDGACRLQISAAELLADHREVAVKAKLLLVLTLANLILLAFSLSQTRVAAAAGAQAPVLRGRALEIVDDQGRVRSTLTVIPADPRAGYPETVLLRLIDSKGRPSVKIATTEDGSALGLGGESDPTGISMMARGTGTSIKLTNKDGHEQIYKP
jgi:hypothetical protein